jgi:hypothetical protein
MKKYALLAFLALSLASPHPVMAFQYAADLYLTLSEEYNDNIFLDRDDEVDDFITRVSPGIDLSLQGERSELRVFYAPSFNFYAKESDLNNTSHSARLTGRYTASERTDFTLLGSYLKTSDINDLRDVADVGPIETQTERTIYSIRGDVTHKLTSALSLALGASYSSSDSEDPVDDNVKTTSGRAGLRYTLSAATSLSADASYSKYNYERDSDSTSQIYTVGVNHKVSPTFTVGLTGGVVFVKDEDTGDTDSGFNGGVTLEKTFEKGSANLSFTQSVTPSADTGETVQYQTVRLSLTRRFGERLGGAAYAAYTKYKSLEGDETDADTAFAGASLSYIFTPWASLSLTYAYINYNDKIDSVNDYTNNIVLLALRLSYSTKPGGAVVTPPPR